MFRSAKPAEKYTYVQKIWVAGPDSGSFAAQMEKVNAIAIRANQVRQKEGTMNNGYMNNSFESFAFLLNPNTNDFFHVSDANVPLSLPAKALMDYDIKMGDYNFTEDNLITIRRETIHVTAKCDNDKTSHEAITNDDVNNSDASQISYAGEELEWYVSRITHALSC